MADRDDDIDRRVSHSGTLQIRCDDDTYRRFRKFASDYRTYEGALNELLTVAEEYPRLLPSSPGPPERK